MPTFAGQMSSGVQANPQWVACDGRYYYGYAALPAPPRPHAGVSTGTRRDYERNVSGWARTRGIGGWMIGVPYDATGTYKVSLADDNVESNLASPPTVQNPPAGVK